MNWNHPVIADMRDIRASIQSEKCEAMTSNRTQCQNCWNTTRPNGDTMVRLCWAHAKEVDEFRRNK